jgi:hypothetical protein
MHNNINSRHHNSETPRILPRNPQPRALASILPPHTLQLLLQLVTYLSVLCPSLAQLLHTDSRNNSQCGRLELRSAFVDCDVGRDAHLGDEVEVLLVAVIVLV